MHILVDTCIWSLALRRNINQESQHTKHLLELIQENRVKIIGSIRQEILSGIKEENHFIRLQQYLLAFPDLILQTTDYEKAAAFSNIARRKGIQGSAIDYLICATAHSHHLGIYTIDLDFQNYSKYLPIKIYNPQDF
jgi:predicted nucleic acid-binding protein